MTVEKVPIQELLMNAGSFPKVICFIILQDFFLSVWTAFIANNKMFVYQIEKRNKIISIIRSFWKVALYSSKIIFKFINV